MQSGLWRWKRGETIYGSAHTESDYCKKTPKEIVKECSKVSYEDNIVLNLYEAFGTTAKKTSGSELQPLLVIEVSENKMVKRYLVPHKYAMEGKWLLYGRHLYVLKGHAFFEHKSSPTFVSCLLCVTTGFRMMQNFFKCMGEDCEYVCQHLHESTVIEPCSVGSILVQEM
ncbi:hypothetical protein TNCT_575911 [Trichonephila clavata]|uniref:Uncharacterized protein n=1 Tax=Trichonephila clavata TaxID=2740835 RepID=A0A8X6HPQ8_TRICU|nr:hypothetical protein TNCT_575911 [Trichonephila clavata]